MHVAGMGAPNTNGNAPKPEPEELPDEMMGGDMPPPINSTGNTQQAQTSNSDDFNKNQVTGLIAVIWVVLLVSIIGIIIVTSIKSKSPDEVSTKESNVPSYNINYTIIDNIQCEDALYKDFIVVDKTVGLNDGNIMPLFTGYAENYKKNVIIPVSLNEYNSIDNKTRIEFTFSRLKISGEEKIVINDWKIAN